MKIAFMPPYVLVLEGPPEYHAAIADDRRWFEEHPQETVRIRPPLPREFHPFEDLYTDVELVRVERLPDGRIVRAPLTRRSS